MPYRAVLQGSVSVVAQPHDVVVLTATVRADHPLDAIADVSSRVDRALLGTGLFLTIRYRFVQVVRFPEALRTIVPELDGFAASITGDADGVLSVSASEPAAAS